MSESLPPEHPPEPGEQSSHQPDDIQQIHELLHTNPWDPDEQVGDVYSVSVAPDAAIDQVRKLTDDEPTSETEPDTTPRIWVGSWSDYNNGILHGRWIDAAREEADIWADIHAMLAASPTTKRYGEPAEEWGIFDFENFGPLRVGEQEDIGFVAKVARGIAEHGLAYAAYADVMEDTDALDGFTDDYLGHYDSIEAYAEELGEDAGWEHELDEALPESLRRYVSIDYDQMATDMDLGGDIHAVPAEDGGLWLFRAQ